MGGFDDDFERLTGNKPFPWQRALYEQFISGRADNIPAICDLPTGVGKTSVIAVWLLARARGANVPRRLVYVVNRRTVVDQTTNEVERYWRKRSAANIPDFAISTLRGQFADNREWSADPSRPAVICGTVDMIGSRLLFSGYGVGFKSKPLHAGLLGQDVLLVHDEAHLEPAFQELIEAIRREQCRCNEFGRFHVMELTATTRSSDRCPATTPFALGSEDRTHPIIKARVEAHKQLSLTPAEDDKPATIGGKIADIAAGYKDSNAAVLVFVRTLDAVAVIERELRKTRRPVVLLTGTMRGKERDELVGTSEFGRFLKQAAGADGTVYLVCTSAGEVGVDMSADHMVCDLSTFESMAQRFGRVNRYGERTDTRIDVVYPAKFDENDKLAPARRATLGLLRKLAGDASPLRLGSLDRRDRHAAFAPVPEIPQATEILFDAWSLTTIRGQMPGRPPVEPYLHGIAEWEPPQTHLAWREEVEIVTGDLLERDRPEDLLEDYPLLPHELLRDRSDRVFKHLQTLAERHADKPVWLIDEGGAADPNWTLGKLAERDQKERINNRTVLLPPSVGGLAGGMLDGASEIADDVADIPAPLPGARVRVMSDDRDYDSKTERMRRVRSIEIGLPEDDDGAQSRQWDWYESIPPDAGETARKPVAWETHVGDVVHNTTRIVAGLSLPGEIGAAVVLAAELHDHGKRRERFQAMLGNRHYPQALWAKGGRRGARLPEPFRHEFASVFDALDDARLGALSDDMRELALHLIAAHHGRARPHFPADEAFDPDRPVSDAEALVTETPRRFARLQRKYGRWGLAYLESLLRAADWAASAAPSAYVDGQEERP